MLLMRKTDTSTAQVKRDDLFQISFTSTSNSFYILFSSAYSVKPNTDTHTIETCLITSPFYALILMVYFFFYNAGGPSTEVSKQKKLCCLNIFKHLKVMTREKYSNLMRDRNSWESNGTHEIFVVCLKEEGEIRK